MKLKSNKVYLHFEEDLTSIEQTNGIEVYTGMPNNSVRVFIWDDSNQSYSGYRNLFNAIGIDTRTNGHIAMAIKDSKQMTTHISMYTDKQKVSCCSSEKSCLYYSWCNCLPLYGPVDFVQYFSRKDNKKDLRGDYNRKKHPD